MAALCIVCAAALAPADRRARRARSSPTSSAPAPRACWRARRRALLLFGGTSADAVYAALGTAAAILLAARGPRRCAGAAGARRRRRCSTGRCWRSAPGGRCWPGGARACARPLVLATGCARLPFSRSRGRLPPPTATTRSGRCGPPRRSTASRWPRSGPYAFWVIGSPVAWALLAGLPIVAAMRLTPAGTATIAVLVIASRRRASRRPRRSASGSSSSRWPASRRPKRFLTAGVRPVVGALLAQALAVQLLFDTIW